MTRSQAIEILTHKELLDRFNYSPETGIMTWLYSPSNNVKVGMQVGTIDKSGYLRMGMHGRTFLLHRLAWFYVNGEMPDAHIDHANGVRSDNRISNLRVANHSQNQMNRKSTLSKKYKGTTFRPKLKKYVAQIKAPGEFRYLGLFNTEIEAALAYDAACIRSFGVFAKPNFSGGL